jgi:WD40 repeat protein
LNTIAVHFTYLWSFLGVRGDLIPRFAGHLNLIGYAIDVSPDGRYVLTGGQDGVILLDFATGRQIRHFQGDPDVTGVVVFSSDGQTAFSAPLSDRWVTQWRITDWPLDKLLPWVHENRYIRDFTCEERAQYDIEPLCE